MVIAPQGQERSAYTSHGMFGMQITSLFMHISPALVCWAWRWYPDPTKVKFDSMSAEQLKAYNTASWWDIGVLSMSTYMIWVVLYYIKVVTHMLSSLHFSAISPQCAAAEQTLQTGLYYINCSLRRKRPAIACNLAVQV